MKLVIIGCIASSMLGALSPAHAENILLGKSPMSPTLQPTVSTEETPNQRRRRLGQPIVASFPAPEFGVKEETPNQKRKRLGLLLPTVTSATSSGILEETPNEKRARLAATHL